MRYFLSVILFLGYSLMYGQSQPLPCGPNAAMTSFCAEACVICDINGYTGVNDLTATGQGFPEFCTTQYNNMQYIAFIAGSVDLTINVNVSNCQGGISSLEVGFFYTEDCENFDAISICDTDIQSGESQTFSNFDPLIIGQHYYLVIDGSNGANCSWTFNVLAGTTEVLPLTSSGVMSFPTETCLGINNPFSTTGELGATQYDWTIGGIIQSGSGLTNNFSFSESGSYEICVTASNVCDEAPPTCETVIVGAPKMTTLVEEVCPGDCFEINNVSYCMGGVFQEVITLSNGCDSTITLDLSILAIEESFIDVWICDDQFFFIGTTPYNVTGSYQETILSSDNCDSIVNLELLTIVCEIIGITSEIPVVCNGTATGSLIFSVDQGTPPLDFTYTNIADASITGMGTTNVLTNNQIDNLPMGTYQIYIEDNFGNDVVVLQDVTEPAVLSIDLVPSDYDGYNVKCFLDNGLPGMDGTLSANLTGGVTPYMYSWSNGQMGQTATNLSYQEYALTVTDAVGCTLEASYTLDVTPEIIFEAVFKNPNCDGFNTGEISVALISGGSPPYVYSLDGIFFQSDNVFSDLLEGPYTLYIRDENACTMTVDGVLVAPDIPVVDLGIDTTILLGDSILMNPIINNSSISSISWVDASTLSCGDCLDPYARPVNDTKYYLTLTSDDGCEGIDSICVFVEKRRRVYVPSAFSPNGDGLNDAITVHAGIEVDYIEFFNIYDRWGNLIYERKNFAPNDFDLSWNGRFKGEKLNPAIFVWVAGVHFIDDVTLKLAGDISLLR